MTMVATRFFSCRKGGVCMLIRRLSGSLLGVLLVLLLAVACGDGGEAENAVPLEEPKDFEVQLNPPVPVRLKADIPETDLYVRTWPSLDKFMSIKAEAETHGLTLTKNGNWVKVPIPGVGQKAYICRCYLELTDDSVDAQGLDASCAEPIGSVCLAEMERSFGQSQRQGG